MEREFSNALIETTSVLRRLAEGKDGLGLAWFQSIEPALHHTATNATTFGPILTARVGKVTSIANPFFHKTFGQNHEPGIDFVYSWHTRAELSHGVALGVELYGRVPDIGGASGPNEHRVGPVLVLETDQLLGGKAGGGAKAADHGSHGGHGGHNGQGGHGDGPSTELEIGVQFGLTEATPKLAGKVNWHVKF